MIPTQQDIAEFTRFQRNEITESILYERLASIEKDENNRKTLRLIAAEEKSHYAILKKYTGKEIEDIFPIIVSLLKICRYNQRAR